jgi:GTP cyclohydrolase II
MSILCPSHIIRYPTQFGEFLCAHISFSDPSQGITGQDHLAIFIDSSTKESCASIASLFQRKEPLVRIHSECLLGDSLFSHLCECGSELTTSFQLIAQEGSGLILYLRQEGRGIGIAEKIKALHLVQQAHNNGLASIDTFKANILLGHPADGRRYAFAADILRYFGAYTIRLLGHNPDKKKGLEDNGITVRELIPLVDYINKASISEFIAKLLKGHQFKPQAIKTVNQQLEQMFEGSLEMPDSLLHALPEFAQALKTLSSDISNAEEVNKLVILIQELSAKFLYKVEVSSDLLL